MWVRMYENYCCGLVLASEKLSDKLKKCKVDVGEGEEKAITVVTNDSKVREGDRLMEQAREHLAGPSLQELEAEHVVFSQKMRGG